MKVMRRNLLVLPVIIATSAPLVSADTRLNPGSVRWANEARTGRADILFIGDSIANYGSTGWSNGFSQAARNGIGLAGTGLQMATGTPSETLGAYTGARVFASGSMESAAAGVPSLAPTGRHYHVGTQFNFLGAGADSVSLDLTKATDWHVFAAGTTPAAVLGARRNAINSSPYSSTPIQSQPNRPISTDFADHVFHFESIQNVGDWSIFAFTPESGNANLYYTKLVQPGETGIAVAGWGSGGSTAQMFRENFYGHSRATPQARAEYLRALVAGNSGSLNVAITFGVNDAFQNISTQSYEASMRGVIADIRSDWIGAGLDPADLSFTLPSVYQINEVNTPPAVFQRLNDYRSVLDAIAASDPGVSFIDIWKVGPTSAEAVAAGYLNDNLHPSALGTRVYGQLLMDQLVPDPGDANIDGHVNFDDLLALAQSYGQPGAWRSGDFNGNGFVDFDDLLVLAQRYDASTFAADWALASSLAPEPSTLLGAMVLALPRRRR